MQGSRVIPVKEGELFFRRWLSSPKSMGSIWPSSRALAHAIAQCVAIDRDEKVVELGGGTGAITQGLIEHGIPADQIMVIELDPSLATYLKRRLPGCEVVQGDATRLGELLGDLGISRIGAVVSGLPMVGMPVEFQQAIVQQALSVLGPDRPYLQYSYSPVPPIPTRRLGVRARLMRYVLWNLPPATVWRIMPR